MMEVYWNLLLFIIILLGVYFFFINYSNQNHIEGLENNKANTSNGIASNSQTYLTNIKNFNMKMKDQFNINNSEYRKNYEDIILNMDDLINNIMLKTTLSVDTNKPDETIMKLSDLSQARTSLNSVLKFLDKQ